MTLRPLILSALTCAGLAACSGGGGIPGAATPTASAPGTSTVTPAGKMPKAPSFDELALKNQMSLAHKRDFTSLMMAKPNPAALVPTSGKGSYTGTIAISDDGSLYRDPSLRDFMPSKADLLGKMALNVDFDSTKVEGAIWDFIDNDGFKQDGSVQLQGLQGENRMDVNGSGTLYRQDGTSADLSVSFAANFYGKKNDKVRGGVQAELEENGVVTQMNGEMVVTGKTY